MYWECGRRGGALPTHTLHAGVLLPCDPVQQYIRIKLPKAEANDRAQKNDVNTLS